MSLTTYTVRNYISFGINWFVGSLFNWWTNTYKQNVTLYTNFKTEHWLQKNKLVWICITWILLNQQKRNNNNLVPTFQPGWNVGTRLLVFLFFCWFKRTHVIHLYPAENVITKLCKTDCTCIWQELTDLILGNFCHHFEGSWGAFMSWNVVRFSENAPSTVILNIGMSIQVINIAKDRGNDFVFTWHLTPFQCVCFSAWHTVKRSKEHVRSGEHRWQTAVFSHHLTG